MPLQPSAVILLIAILVIGGGFFTLTWLANRPDKNRPERREDDPPQP